jgi:hypothetical protein
MRFLAATLLAAIALSAGCGSDEPSPSSSGSSDLADLTVTLDNDGDGGNQAKTMTLTCKAPTDSQACGAAAGISEADLAPTKTGTACTQVFGGPETATIKGTIRGNQVDSKFSRTDGCEIERWANVEPLLSQVR